jgi:hypothetical protein
MTLNDEIREQFTSAEMQSDVQNSSDVVEQPTETVANVDEWLNAPKSYTKEYQENFKELPQTWRKYLIDREKQVERGFSDLGNKANAYKYIEDAYNSRQERLSNIGIKGSKDYFGFLTGIDDALNQDPSATIQALADAYNIPFGATMDNSNELLQKQIRDLQLSINQQQQFIKEQQSQKASQTINDFVNAKLDNGQPKHPYFEDVRQDMVSLIRSGLCDNLDDAYSRAIWSNETVRNKLLAEQTKIDLDNKMAETEKAKTAGFSPKSKATPTERELSLREELERNFNKYN